MRRILFDVGPVLGTALPLYLRALTLIDRVQLRLLNIPPLYQSGVRYKRERGDREVWRTCWAAYRRRAGDCEDLACWLAAETGGRAVPVRTRIGWHIVTRLPDGRIEDPSKRLGM